MKKVIVISVIFLMFACQTDDYKLKQIALLKQVTFTDLSPEYIINYSANKLKNELRLKQTDYQKIISGNIFFFTTDKKISIKTLKVTPPNHQYFKLYLNKKYFGKFTNGQNIKINRNVNSLKILFLKNPEEKFIHAWQNDTVIYLIKHKKNKIQTLITLALPTKDTTIIFHIKHTRKSNSNQHINKKFINRYLKNKPVIAAGMFYKKHSKSKTQFSIQIHHNQTITIYQLITNTNSKKLIKKLMFTGRWTCNQLTSNSANLLLNGILDSEAKNKPNKNTRQKVLLKATFNNNRLYFNEVLNPIFIDFQEHAMVNIKDLIPSAQISLAYASTENFTKSKLYLCNKCFLRYKIAKALQKIQYELQSQGFKLKFFDCYRPYSVQKLLFEKFPVKGYVASPVGGSIHNRGLAVDLTIIDKNGKELEMGTPFDDFSVKARHSYIDLADTILKNRLFLKNLMIKYGFSPIRSEWWHYNYRPTHRYPIINDEFLCD